MAGKSKDALTLIGEVADQNSLDELGRRARGILALKEPSEADLHDLVSFWRQTRVTWKQE